MCVCVCVRVHMRTTAYMWRRSEDSFQELIFSFHHVGSRDRTQEARLVGLVEPRLKRVVSTHFVAACLWSPVFVCLLLCC